MRPAAIVPIRSFDGLTRLAAFYLVLTVSLSLVLRWYEKRIQVPG